MTSSTPSSSVRPRRLAMAELLIISGFSSGLIVSAEPIQITEDVNGRNIRDNSGDGLGNQVAGIDTLARVGEHTSDADQTRYFLPFVLTPEARAFAAEGGKIELSLSLGAKGNVAGIASSGGPVDLHVDILGFINRDSELPAPEDFENPDTVLLFSSAMTPATPTNIRIFDVTDFVRDQSAYGEVVVFRLQVSPPDVLPNGDGKVNRYLIHTQAHATGAPPTLTVFPFQPFITAGSDQHRNISDTTGDGMGDLLNAAGDTLGRVGEHPTQDASQSRWYLPFQLSAENIDEILGAELVTLNIPFGISTAVTGLLLGDDSSIRVTEDWNARNIRDTTGDGLGNTVQGSDTLARVGELTLDGDQTRYYMPFVLGESERQAVVQGARVNLAFSYGTATNISGVNVNGETVDLNLDVFGFLGRESQFPEPADYHDLNVVLLHAGALAPGMPTGIHTFDVTDFVKEQSALGAVVAFRLQIDPPDVLPNSDGVLNRYLLHTHAHATAPAPRLEIYPEWPVPTTNLEVEIVGFTGRTDLAATVEDYHATDVQVLYSPAPGFDTGGYRTFDITEFAKQEAAQTSILAFRFQIDPPDALPFGDGLWNRYLFQGAGHASGNFPYIHVIDDLPYTAWRKNAFPGEEDPNIVGPFVDHDGDGIPNIVEFGLAGNPNLADRSILPVLDIMEIGDFEYLTITFTRLQDIFDIQYLVQSSTDLVEWMGNAVLVGSPIDHEDGTITVTYRSPSPASEGGRTFLRLLIEKLY